MRRGVGVAGIKRTQEQKNRLASQGNELDKVQMEQMKKQLIVFKEKLESFAVKHKNDINKDPVLRKRFHEMCNSIGVDPLSSNKGFWSQLLGVGDFYYEIAVQIIDICLRTRHKNGGFIEVSSLCIHLNRIRSKQAQPVSVDDVERSIAKLKILGNGFALKKIGIPPDDCRMVQSVPLELDTDHTVVLQLAREKEYVTKSLLQENVKWEERRCIQVLEFLEEQGLAWIDDGDKERRYYFPSVSSKFGLS